MLMVNRNAGSGTRILADRLPGNTRPDGYAYQTRSHTAVAVTQSLVNWGIAIASVAHAYGSVSSRCSPSHMAGPSPAPG